MVCLSPQFSDTMQPPEGSVGMMQIDCEIFDTQLIHIRKSVFPQPPSNSFYPPYSNQTADPAPQQYHGNQTADPTQQYPPNNQTASSAHRQYHVNQTADSSRQSHGNQTGSASHSSRPAEVQSQSRGSTVANQQRKQRVKRHR